MFSPWLSAVNSGELSKNVSTFRVEKLDKMRLLLKAQQKLASSVSTSLDDLLVKDCDFIDNRPAWSIFGLDEYNVFIPKLKSFESSHPNVLECMKQNWFYDNNRCFNKEKLERLRLISLKEPMIITSSCRSLLKSCVKGQSCEFKPLECCSIKPNALFYDVSYDLVFQRNHFHHTDGNPAGTGKCQMYTKWDYKSNLILKQALSENEQSLELGPLLFGHEHLNTIPSLYFLGDYIEERIPLPTYLTDSYRDIDLTALFSRWKFRKSLTWKREKSYLFEIVDEPIRKLELKYKFPLLSLVIAKSYCQIMKSFCAKLASKKWVFSEYKTYMMNREPFSTLKLESVLVENETYTKFTIPSMILTDDNDRYLKLSDIENDCKALLTTSYELIPVNISQYYDNSSVNKISQSFLREEDKASLLHIDNDSDHKSFSQTNRDTTVIDHEVQSSNTKLTALLSTPKSEDVNPAAKPETGSVSGKRTVSEMSSITLKKRKRVNITQFGFSKKYPYLDVLNQTTGSFSHPEIVLPRTQAAPRKVINKFQKQDTPPNVEDANILDTSEIDFEETVLNVPSSQVCNVMLNVNFATKFGAAFHQFNNIVEKNSEIMLNEFKMNGFNLEFDMFLNTSCGVIFFRPINIYQIDIHSGENLVFRQMSEIAMQVTSLIVVIAVDKTVRLENDEKLLSFIKNAEDFGIQIFVVESDPKTIAVSMLELIQKYSVFDEVPFSWTAENQFLEVCGVSNPFLSQWILETWSLEDFVKQSEEERACNLLRMCTTELARHINRAVQNFTDAEI
ncbi:hypothetical protein PMKS-000068 [Pichia membranifaciens]|uniref:Uncharacterized protein n=1 Tax=Pichia membranifaciens TaxID=4926 RepID=A0A1Q2YAP6_9ASCO|nr:hypothetical protein PMKS-000068 [Pichia membranifaciens]